MGETFSEFLSDGDPPRMARSLEKLAKHDLSHWALTGGFAIEIYCRQHGRPTLRRPLNDIDFIVDSFDSIPKTLADEFLFRHVHPFDPPGKTLLQMIDVEGALRIDVFRAFGGTMSRTCLVHCDAHPVRLVSLEDLLARSARLALDLAGGAATPAKYARDFLRLSEIAKTENVELAWLDQRKSSHPTTFREVDALLHELIPASAGLLITPEYSQDAETTCARCMPTEPFGLADRGRILSVLGYC